MDTKRLEELFIVLTLPRQDLTPALKLRRQVAKRYDLYPDNNYPQLHITLNRVAKDDAESAVKIMEEAAKTVDEVKIKIDNLKCFKYNDNFLVLDVNHTASLERLANQLNTQLSNRGLSKVENYAQWQFHITLISNFFTANPMPELDLEQLCLALDGQPQSIVTCAQRLELWRPTLDPEQKVIKTINL
ncbi:MAG: 2'-5' RNA ligase family protein [Bacillota bacterium]